jgi:hypothetical protein
MTRVKSQAEAVTAALSRILSADPSKFDAGTVCEVIEQALAAAAQVQEKKDLKRIAEVQASAHAHLSRLLNASPAVIYCRLPDNDFQLTFVSESVSRLFGLAHRSIGHV